MSLSRRSIVSRCAAAAVCVSMRTGRLRRIECRSAAGTASRSTLSNKLLRADQLLAFPIVAVLFCAFVFCATVPLACAQQLSLLGLRSQNGLGQFVGLKADAAGNLYTLFDAGDGVRLLKLDPAASQVLGEVHIGQAGDQPAALAIDPAGNLYVTGTSLSSGSVSGTPGTSFPARADSTTNSFLARVTPALTVQWVTFLGSGKMASTAVDASATQVVVTGGIFSPTLPVTNGGIQQTPLPGSSGNGFVESFSTASGTLNYATYLSGADGDTEPSGIALGADGSAYIVGTTSATGFPTVNALVPFLLSDAVSPVSGFLTALTPAGDGLTFSTFVPGNGLSSVAVDTGTATLLVSGDLARGFFPILNTGAPIAGAAAYQSAVRFSLDGSTVLQSALLIPGTASSISPGQAGEFAFTATARAGSILPPFSGAGSAGALEPQGNAWMLSAAADSSIKRMARLGGLPVNGSGFASLPAQTTGVLAQTDGGVLAVGGLAPTLSSALLPTQRYDFTQVTAPNAALPSTVRDALPPASCSGSACSGGAGLLARLANGTAPQLALSTDNLPNLILRNVGPSEATGVQLSVSGYSYRTACGTSLPAGAECDILLIGNGPGNLTVSSGNSATVTSALPATSLQAATVSVSPRELDFGSVSAASGSRTRTLTLVNLASASQTVSSELRGVLTSAFKLSESSSDCIPAGDNLTKILPANSTCHITLALSASGDPAGDGIVNTQWTIGSNDIAVTGYTQAAALSVSAAHIGFGRHFSGGLRLPRTLFLSNGSDLPQPHTSVSLPAHSPFTLQDGCPATLPPQSVCRLDLTYLSSTSPSADAVTLSLDSGLSVLIDGETLPPPSVTGASVNPSLAVSPLVVTFANPVVATTVSSETQVVTIQNTGTVDFPLSVSVTGDFAASTCPATLTGGAACAVTLTFVPSGAGTRGGLLSVAAGSAAPVYVNLSGSGTGFLPVENGSVNFGEVPLHTPAVQWFKVADAFTSLHVESSAPDFGLLLVEDNGYGHGTPNRGSFTQDATGPCLNCWIGVQFDPATTGAQLATLTVASTSGGSSLQTSLAGSGRALSGVVLTPLSQDFGPVPMGSVTASSIFVLTNASGSSTEIAPPTFTGDFSKSSIVTGATACGGSLADGESCLIPIQFAPTANGVRNGAVSVATGAGTLVAGLTGFGTPDPGLHFSPGELRFLNVPDAAASVQTITLTNTGQLSALIGEPLVSDPHFAPSTTCANLAPNSTCTLTVSYSPTLSLSSGVLTLPVTTFPGGSPQTTIYTFPLDGLYTQENAGIQIVPGESDAIDFGAVMVGSIGGQRTLRVNNLSGKPLTVAVETPRQFPLVASTCGGLAPGGTCTLTVNYQPLTGADATGTVYVQGLPTDGSATVDGLGYLQGYGLAGNTFAVTGNLSPAGVLDFGQVASGQSSTAVLTLTNRGGAAPGSTGVTVRRILTEAPFLSTTSCGETLPLNGSCTVTVTYAPLYQTQIGTGVNPLLNTGVLTIEADTGNAPLLVDLAGTASAAQTNSPANNAPLRSYAVSQGALFFTTGAVGTASAAQSLTLSNTGTAALHITGLLTPPDFTATGSCGTLNVGASCTLNIAFTPKFAGQRGGALEIQSDSSNSLEYVSLLGSSTPASVALTPESLNFGSVLIGQSASAIATFTNTGTTAVTLGAVAATGDFSVTGSTGGATPCIAGSSVSAGASCSVPVSFTPAHIGTRTGTLTISSSATPQPLAATLSGLGIQPQLVATPNSLTFGDVLTGHSASLSFTLSNGSGSPVNALNYSIQGDYAATSTCGPVTLAAGSSCSITVTFTPTQTGTRRGTLSVASSDPASPLSVPLTGNGIQGGSFNLTVNGGGTASTAVQQGIAAGFPLVISPTGGFMGQVALTCTPQASDLYVACSIATPAVTLLNGPESSSVSITTVTAITGTAQARPIAGQYSILLAVTALPVLLLLRRRYRPFPILLAAAALLTVVSGCGSGAGDSRLRYAATGSYRFIVTASSTTGVPVSQSVEVTVNVTAR